MKDFKRKIQFFSTVSIIMAALMLFMTGCQGTPNIPTFEVSFITQLEDEIPSTRVHSGTLLKDVPGFVETVEKTGVTFKYWTVNGEEVNPETYVILEDVIVEAKWVVSVTFNANGGKFSDGSTEDKVIEFDIEGIITAPEVSRAREGNKCFGFSGWSTTLYDVDAENQDEFNLFEGSSSHITLYAYYYVSEEYYTISFDTGIEENTIDSIEVLKSTKLKNIKNFPTTVSSDDLTFKAWQVSDLDIDENFEVASDVTLKAHWVAVVTFDPNGGKFEDNSSSTKKLECELGTKLSAITDCPADPEKDSLTFNAWQITEDIDGNYVVNKNTTVKAHWVAVVTIEANGGKFDDNTSTPIVTKCEVGTKLSELTVLPSSVSKTDVTFKSWSISEQDVASTYVVNTNCTIKPHWVAVVTFNANGGKFNDDSTSKDIEVEIGSTVTAPKINRDDETNLRYLCKNWTLTQYADNAENPVLFDLDEAISKNITLYAYFTSIPKTDYLMLMYMDGDNNLNDAIWCDINEAEYGLSFIRNSGNMFDAKDDCATVNVIALWDGWNVRTADPDDEESAYAQLGTSGTYLYQLGIDTGCDISSLSSTGVVLSSTTKDLSSKVSWLGESHEADMSNRETLKNFLTWANDNYAADHVILQFSNHGGGPRSKESSKVVLPNGLEFYNPDPSLRRAMCWDDTSGEENFITTKDIPWAIAQSGLNKVDMIVEDVCLGASVEEAYELRNSAKYLLASPNNIPGNGLDYVAFMKHFTAENLAKDNGGMTDIGTSVIQDYKAQYKLPDATWASFKTYVEEQLGSEVTNEQLSLFYTSRATLSLIDLSKMDAVKTAFNALYTAIYNVRDKSINDTIMYNSSKKYLQKCPFKTYVKFSQLLRYVYNEGLYDDELNMIHISYEGTFAWLHDSADLSTNIKTLISSLSNASTYSIVTSKCTALQTALGNAIVSAWADGYKPSVGTNNSSGALYEVYGGSLTYLSIYNKKGYGLTVCGESIAGTIEEGNIVYTHGVKPSFYDSALSFSADSSWGKALTLIFGDN